MFADIKQRFLAQMVASGEADERTIQSLKDNIRRDEEQKRMAMLEERKRLKAQLGATTGDRYMSEVDRKQEKIESDRRDLQRKMLALFDGVPDSEVEKDFVKKAQVSLLGGELDDGTRVLKTTRKGGRGLLPGVYDTHPGIMKMLYAAGGKPTLMFCYQTKEGRAAVAEGCPSNRSGILKLKEVIRENNYKQMTWASRTFREEKDHDLLKHGFVRAKNADKLLVYGIIAEYQTLDHAMADCSDNQYRPVFFQSIPVKRRMVVACFDLNTGERDETFRIFRQQTCGGFNDIIDTIRFKKDSSGREVLQEIKVTMPMINII